MARVKPSKAKAMFVPIKWYSVSSPVNISYEKHSAAKDWCRAYAGVEYADWQYQPVKRRWRFRDKETMMMFSLGFLL
jgi:hypothetical protein